MNNNLVVIFSILTIINVILSTIKSIVTIKSSPWVASLISALYYGFYSIVVVYTVADFPLWQKVLITFLCNLVGVFVVKWGEAKARKDKLWLVKITVPADNFNAIYTDIKTHDIPCTYYDLQKYYVLDCYCNAQEETAIIINLCKKYHGKMFASENKLN